MTRIRFADEYSRMAIYDRWLGFADVRGTVRLTGLVDFGTEPQLLTFGDQITIADGVRFLTHDGAVAVFRNEIPDLHLHLPINVADNVFIGSDSLILPGVTIGSNSIIGAGSVVSRDVPSGWVVAGCPARQIKTIAQYRTTVFRKAGIAVEEKDFADQPVADCDKRRGWVPEIQRTTRPSIIGRNARPGPSEGLDT